MRLIIGVDMSYARACISEVSGKEGVVHICPSFPVPKKSFPGLLEKGLELISFIDLLQIPFGKANVVMEVPPPVSNYSAGLFLLDGMFFQKFLMNSNYLLVPPTAIASFCGRRVSKKEVKDFVISTNYFKSRKWDFRRYKLTVDGFTYEQTSNVNKVPVDVFDAVLLPLLWERCGKEGL